MLTTTEKAIIYAILALLTAPLWLYAVACIADNACRDDDYLYSGSCPDSPECEQDIYPTFYTHQPETEK